MARIRALVVDDSVLIRRLLTDTFADDPDIEVAATASSGKTALAKLSQINPDVVILDVEMPEMNGLETLRALRTTYPTLPVIMFSGATQTGAAVTLEALSLGANDYASKPVCTGPLTAAQERIRTELSAKIRRVCRVASIPRSRLQPAAPGASGLSGIVARGEGLQKVDLVAIGVSTGGPNALCELFSTFPPTFPVPIVVVQHMPPIFTRLLAERLTATTQLQASEGNHGEIISPGRIYLAPGDYHMTVHKAANGYRLGLNQNPHENSCRPAVDPLFRSVADAAGARSLGVVLTGMGQDGLRGAESIHAAGGRILAQDEASSVVWGMAGAVSKSGLASRTLPLKELPQVIMRSVGCAVGLVSPASRLTTQVQR